MQLEMQVMLPFVCTVYKVICCLSHQYLKWGQACLHESDSKCIKTMDRYKAPLEYFGQDS